MIAADDQNFRGQAVGDGGVRIYNAGFVVFTVASILDWRLVFWVNVPVGAGDLAAFAVSIARGTGSPAACSPRRTHRR